MAHNVAATDNGSTNGTGPEDHVDLLLASKDLADFLKRLADVCSQDLSVVQPVLCSVTVTRERRRDTIASSDGAATLLDAIQYGSGEGPCQDAALSGQPVYVADMRTDPRYPRYRRALADSDIRAVFATPIPLTASSRASAALNCYSAEVDGLPAPARERAQELARLASKSLLLAVRLAEHQDRAADLEAAIASRTTINLAAGVIMAQTGCTQTRAIEILKTASMNRNEKVKDIAAQILARFDDVSVTTTFS